CAICRRAGSCRYVEFFSPHTTVNRWVLWRYPLVYEADAWGELCPSCIARSFARTTARTLFMGAMTGDFVTMPFQLGRNCCWLIGKPGWVNPFTYACLGLVALLVVLATIITIHGRR